MACSEDVGLLDYRTVCEMASGSHKDAWATYNLNRRQRIHTHSSHAFGAGGMATRLPCFFDVVLVACMRHVTALNMTRLRVMVKEPPADVSVAEHSLCRPVCMWTRLNPLPFRRLPLDSDMTMTQ